MKTTYASAVLVLSLTVLPGCGEKATPGGATNNQQPMVGTADSTFKLTVPGNLPETSVKEGGATPFKIGITRGKNFNDDVTLKFEGTPTGVTVDPATATIKHDATDTTVTIKATDDAPTGSFTLKVTGTPAKGGAAVSEFKVNVTKKANPAAYTVHVPAFSTGIKQGEAKEATISIKRDSGFDEDVTLKFDGLPAGLTVDPASPVIKQGQTEAKVTLKAAGDAALGEKTIKVTGHSASGIETAQDLKVTIEKK